MKLQLEPVGAKKAPEGLRPDPEEVPVKYQSPECCSHGQNVDKSPLCFLDEIIFAHRLGTRCHLKLKCKIPKQYVIQITILATNYYYYYYH